VKREQLEHVLRSAAQIAGDSTVLIIGSQSVLGAIPDHRLPPAATRSVEVDVAFFDDLDDRKADMVDGAIGELSTFHSTYGYYAQGVSVTTATLPVGWRERLVAVESRSTAPGRGLALDPHDCVVSKLVAGREKDYEFAGALLAERLVDADVLVERIGMTDVPDMLRQRILAWIASVRRTG
jgi:hypothetical protein